jgi:SpoIVB peptidase S55
MSRFAATSAAPAGDRRDGRARPRRPWAAAALGLLLLGARAPVVAASAGEAPASPVVLMPLEDIRPGMQGIARTVFEGSNLEEFKVEILGVLKGAIGPQQDMIVARLRGDKVEYTGVVSGMSGSPVYIDGKLIGAVSYRLGQFAKEAIAGITPIADMIKLAGPVRAADAGAQAPDLLGRFLASRAGVDGPIAGSGGGPQRPGTEAPPLPATGGPPGGLQPIGIPLVCSGCDAGVLRYYAPIFESFGLEPTAGGGATTSPSSLPLLPGTAIGAALATGDMNLVGIGTLTHVDGNRVFAFGHPMLGTGPMEMPMTQAQVLLTFASSAASFKIANSTPPVGTIVQDGLTAIVGEVGREAPTIPVSVRVTSHGRRRDFHYAIMRNRAWSPVLFAVTTANSLVRTVDFDAGASLALHCRLDLDGYPPVTFEDLYSGTNPGQPVHLALANEAAGVFGFLVNNRFEEPRVRNAEIDVEVLPGSQVATMASLRASRTEVRPGDSVTVTAVLDLYRGREWEESWTLTIPEDTAPGDAEIVVGSGPAIDGLDRRVIERQVAQAAGLGDLVRLATRQRRSRTLYLRMTRRAPTAIVRSEVLPDLPLSIFTVFNNPRLSADTTLMNETSILELPKDLDVVVVGGRRISIRVK